MCFKRLKRSKDLIFTKQNLGTYCMTIKSKMLLQTAGIIGLFLSFIVTASLFEESRFKYRLLLLDVTQGLSIESIESLIKESENQLIARKLKIIAIDGSAIKVIFGVHSEHHGAELATIRQRLSGRTVTLIGLDGGVKADYDTFDLQKVFSNIDRMPMRRAELRK